MGLSVKGKIGGDKKKNGLKKKCNKQRQKSEEKRDGTAEKSINKLKRKSETARDGSAKKAKKHGTEDQVSSDLDGKTEFINKLGGDSGNGSGDGEPASRNEELGSYRLFVKMKNKIISEEDVKNMHPDVTSVRFPRKKRTRWCWAIFENEEKAVKALQELKHRKDIIVNKPSTKSKESIIKRKKPLKAKRKKEIKNKLLATWL